MAGKVVNSSFGLLSKFVTGGQVPSLKTATSHMRKPLALIALKEETAIFKVWNHHRK